MKLNTIKHVLPLVAATSIAMFAMPANAFDDDCKPPKTRYSKVSCSSDNAIFIAYNNDYQIQALLNTNGKVVADLRGYDDIDSWNIHEGVFAVLKNDKVGYMNSKGQLVVPAIYDNLRDPDDKYDETWANPAKDGRIVVGKNGKFGIIDLNNKVILPFNNRYAYIDAYNEGMAAVRSRNNKWGFIDKNGVEVVAPQYDDIDGNFGGIYGFSQGLVGVAKGEKWGFITKTGKVAVPFVYDEIRPFREQLAGVRKGNKWGFINGANKTVIPFKYADANVERYSVNYMGATYFNFIDGQAIVATINNQDICINKSDQRVTCR